MLRKTLLMSQSKNSLSKGLKRQMSIQQPQNTKAETSSKKQDQLQCQQLKQVVHNASTIRYHQLVKQPFAGSSDSTLLYNIAIAPDTTIRKRHLVIKDMQYLISNWTADDFPNVIYLSLDGYQGYKVGGYTAVQYKQALSAVVQVTTDKVGALQLIDVQAIMDQSDVRTYELRYSLKNPITWQLPLTLMDLKFRVKLDDTLTAIPLPLPSPMVINLQIRQDK